jgi:hypothetical protein
MRIIIEFDEGETGKAAPTVSTAGVTSPSATGPSPPPGVLQQAAASGAISAGPAPTAPASEGPPPFIPTPGTSATLGAQAAPPTTSVDEALSAGAAPDIFGTEPGTT